MKFKVVDSNLSILDWLLDLIPDAVETASYDSADLIVFPGGGDVDPSLYGEPVGQYTSPDRGDGMWQHIFLKYLKNKKFLGICKGSQFLCAMAGGKLFQHVTNHALFGTHMITVGNKKYEVTSTHHQMMNPFTMDEEHYNIFAHSEKHISDIYMNGYDDALMAPPVEPEAVFFKYTNSLAIQFHPEFMSMRAPVQKVVRGWIEDLMKAKPIAQKDDVKKAVKAGTGLYEQMTTTNTGQYRTDTSTEWITMNLGNRTTNSK